MRKTVLPFIHACKKAVHLEMETMLRSIADWETSDRAGQTRLLHKRGRIPRAVSYRVAAVDYDPITNIRSILQIHDCYVDGKFIGSHALN